MNIEALKEAHDLSLDGRDFAARQIILDVIANLEKEALMSVPDGAQPSVIVEQEPVATDWERIARVQDAKLRAMCNEAGGFEKLCEVMDKYEQTTPPQRKPLTEQEIGAILEDTNAFGPRLYTFARAIEAAHGIKGEA